jgi:thiamine kinase-like enzyme
VWTVTHNDSHPGNFIWNPKTKGLIMCDFEIVGPGNPAIDVACFLAFRTTIEFRRKYEREFLQIYYDHLTSGGRCKAEDYPFERFWEDYKYVGATRLAFYVASIPCFLSSQRGCEQYLDCFGAFLKDHGITAETMRPLVY